jgi:hypothetical protein
LQGVADCIRSANDQPLIALAVAIDGAVDCRLGCLAQVFGQHVARDTDDRGIVAGYQ